MPADELPVFKPRSVGEILDEWETTLGQLLHRARALERLNERVSALLPADLARHCQVANLREGRLVFACTSSGCATRLRLQAPDLLERLHSVGLRDVDTVIVKMVPPT